MNVRRRVLLAIGLAVGICLGFMIALRAMQNMPKGGDDGASFALESRMKTIEADSRLLLAGLAAQSNRADAAEMALREEKNANEPLRKKIEALVATSEKARAAAEEKVSEAEHRFSAALQAAREESDALKVKLEESLRANGSLQVELDALRKEKAAAEKQK